ncbi:MAG: NADH-quinone oxidoreductase subunit NuoF [Nitrospirae bacterium]|nr:NADH-quinone oxidoreductase subunit NuoF [Nitrospirota bacterium]
MDKIKSIEEFENLSLLLKEEVFKEGVSRIRMCVGTACMASGADKVAQNIKSEAALSGRDVEIVATGCQGFCQQGPVMKVEPYGYYYQHVKAGDAREIVTTTLSAGFPVRKLLHRDSIMSEPCEIMETLPYYKKQLRIALKNNGLIDPRNIRQYIAVGGYRALAKALKGMTPDEVLDEVDKANLRGRGGAGFPAGKKWRHSKNAPGDVKFVIANGDEGDPGAFMDRSIMEGDPHGLLEGMLLNAYALGARYGFIYVRHEYPLAVENLRIAIKQANQFGFLGDNILGTNFSFHLDIREGAGAFVCGESTALIASIEGDRGFPRPRPPRLSEKGGGAWGYPSNLNNIETFANVPHIIEKGADWFKSIGTKNSPGTKVFALTGKVNNTGLVEVPMGITLREIIFEIGGGILDGKKFKAVQTGGPSGGCLTEEFLDLPVDFDSLTKAGSMMGSGGMVVMDEDTCVVDVAKFFLSFTKEESCGKCPPCRLGTYQMYGLLEKITSGKGQHGDIERLEKICHMVHDASLCGLGQSAPNPILSTLRYFRQEYEEHVYEGYCRAKVCGGMGVFTIDNAECFLCGLCKQACAFGAVKETRRSFFIDQDTCTKCKACYMACPIGAVKVGKVKNTDAGKQRDAGVISREPVGANRSR